MSLYTQFIFQIDLMMIWLSILSLDMYDDLLDLQVVQCCKQSILTSCIYGLDMGCLFPLIFHYLFISNLVPWILVAYGLSHKIFIFFFMKKGWDFVTKYSHGRGLQLTISCWQVGHIENQMLDSWMWSWWHRFWYDMIGYIYTSLMFISLDF